MKGKIQTLETRKARRERAVYQAAVESMQEAGLSQAEGIAVMLHVAVALAEGMAATGAQMRLMQGAMTREIDRAVVRSINGRRDDPARRLHWWERAAFALRVRMGLRWRT